MVATTGNTVRIVLSLLLTTCSTPNGACSDPAAAARERAVQPEHEHGTENRREDSWPVLVATVHPEHAADREGHHRTRDAEQRRQDDPASVTPRHEQLCQRTDHQTDD